MKKRKIEVKDYCLNWPEQYLKEIKLIKRVLSSEIITTHHIGSTAVPNLAAKPVIDILLEVKNVINLDEYDEEMKKLHYIPKGEFGILGRRFYIKGEIERTHHIHAFNENSFEVKRHLAFKDYLNANPKIADEYGLLKKQNAQKCNDDVDKYCDLKNDFFKYHEQKAMKWWNDNYPNAAR